MGVACLRLPSARLREYAAVFEARARALVAALRDGAGWEVPMPKACARRGGALGRGRGGACECAQAAAGAARPSVTYGTRSGSAGQKHHRRRPRRRAAGMYLWAQLPRGFGAVPCADFCLALLAATGVALAPGSGFGPGGAGRVRFALVREEAALLAAAGEIAAFLRSPAAAALRARGGGGGSAAASIGGPAATAAVASPK